MKLVHEGTSSASPVWDVGSASLLWTDGPTIHRLHPGSGTHTETVVPQPIGAVLPRTNGGLVTNLRDGIGLHHADGRMTWLVYWHRDGAEAGPAAIDHTGDLGAMTGKQLVRVQPDGRATVMLDGVAITGLAATDHVHIATLEGVDLLDPNTRDRTHTAALDRAELANPSGDDRAHTAAPNSAELFGPSDDRARTAVPNSAETLDPNTDNRGPITASNNAKVLDPNTGDRAHSNAGRY